MDLSISIFLIFSYCVWDTESRAYTTILSVTNGGKWGDWGKEDFCTDGYARSFAIKAQKKQGAKDDTGLNAIRLICENGQEIQSTVGQKGTWSRVYKCPEGNLMSFTLNVEPSRGKMGDDTAANNIQFSCTDGTILKGEAKEWGKYGEWSKRCPAGGICGIQTKVEPEKGAGDDTALNDVQFFCCD
ncbi:vitelline membrane outer layer protein 1-like [Sceloporus undulatus]|uniref:vitelline membrane outer layer protein 1-like n=1 Tax=Sceloporus undulatus TaxID=8520 RepID=UPI001C4C4B8B|nr:vitelline membrane outer layer protein 1-like [Sceloporus undulatus]